MGTGKYHLPTFRSSFHTFSLSPPLISPHPPPFCLLLGPSFPTFLHCPTSCFSHLRALQPSASISSFSHTVSPRPYVISIISSPIHLLSPSHSSCSSLSLLPLFLSTAPRPFCSGLKESLIYSNKKKKRKNPFIGAGIICAQAIVSTNRTKLVSFFTESMSHRQRGQ